MHGGQSRWPQHKTSEGRVVVEPAGDPAVVLASDLLKILSPHPDIDALPQDLLAYEPCDVSVPSPVLVASPGQEKGVPVSTLDADDRREPQLFPHNSNILASLFRADLALRCNLDAGRRGVDTGWPRLIRWRPSRKTTEAASPVRPGRQAGRTPSPTSFSSSRWMKR
jgi:hypothetical protein